MYNKNMAEGIEVAPGSPKEQAEVWANRGLPWAALEYCNLADIQGKNRNDIMSTAHQEAAARYQDVNESGSAVGTNAFTSEGQGLSSFVAELERGKIDSGWGVHFYKTLKYGGIYPRALAQETVLNFLAHKELAEHYKKP